MNLIIIKQSIIDGIFRKIIIKLKKYFIIIIFYTFFYNSIIFLFLIENNLDDKSLYDHYEKINDKGTFAFRMNMNLK